MATANTKKIKTYLLRLKDESPHIEAIAVISTKGLTIASSLSNKEEEDRVSAISGPMLGLGRRIGKELGSGQVEQVYAQSEKGNIILTPITYKTVLMVLVDQKATMGMILIETRRAAKDLISLVK